MTNFIQIHLFFWGLLQFISYSEHLSVIHNNKNYGSLWFILFIVVQNSWITLDRPQCIVICSKFKMASLLLKNSIAKVRRVKTSFHTISGHPSWKQPLLKICWNVMLSFIVVHVQRNSADRLIAKWHEDINEWNETDLLHVIGLLLIA